MGVRSITFAAAGLLFLAALTLAAPTLGVSEEALVSVQRVLFLLTLVLEAMVVVGAWRVLSSFERGEVKWIQWVLFGAFMAVRFVAELRLLTLYFDLLPEPLRHEGPARFFYIDVLRFTYSISDLLLIVGLVYTWDALFGRVLFGRGQGARVPLRLRSRDAPWFLLMPLLPVGALLLRRGLATHTVTAVMPESDDPWLQAYRLLAVVLVTISVFLCAVLLSFARQLGTGAVARVWWAIVAAGVGRALSFLVLAAVAPLSAGTAVVLEQLFLLYFAWCWLAAVQYERALGSLFQIEPGDGTP
ncbi:MAG: hypothetical protein AAFU77_06610 [Myxococcota bacterium]